MIESLARSAERAEAERHPAQDETTAQALGCHGHVVENVTMGHEPLLLCARNLMAGRQPQRGQASVPSAIWSLAAKLADEPAIRAKCFRKFEDHRRSVILSAAKDRRLRACDNERRILRSCLPQDDTAHLNAWEACSGRSCITG